MIIWHWELTHQRAKHKPLFFRSLVARLSESANPAMQSSSNLHSHQAQTYHHFQLHKWQVTMLNRKFIGKKSPPGNQVQLYIQIERTGEATDIDLGLNSLHSLPMHVQVRIGNYLSSSIIQLIQDFHRLSISTPDSIYSCHCEYVFEFSLRARFSLYSFSR